MKRNADIILDMVHGFCDQKEVIVYRSPEWLASVVYTMAARAGIIPTREEVESIVSILMTEY